MVAPEVTAPTRPLYSTTFGVGVFVELLAAFPRSPIPSLFEDQKGTAAPKCYGVIAMSNLCLVNPFGLLQNRTTVIEKYKRNLELARCPPNLACLLFYLIMELSYVCHLYKTHI